MSEEKNKSVDNMEKKLPPQFIPALRGRKVLCRMSDGRPLNAVLAGWNAYEILFDLGNGKKMLIFKHAISSIEFTESEGDRGGPGTFR